MRRFLLSLALLPVFAAGYCSLPLTSVAILIVTVTDQAGRPIEHDARTTYLDAAGTPIVTITSTTHSSWRNNLQWWSHSSHRTSTLRPGDARRAVAVEVAAKGCETARLSVKLRRRYEPLSLSPHGGGPAYFIYRFSRQVALRCS